MGLIICPDCKKEISDKAESCPNCGRPMNALPKKVKICAKCNKNGISSEFQQTTIKKVPSGANFVAGILIVIGIPSLFFAGAGLIPILIATLIISLGKKDYQVLKCPKCKGIIDL